MQSARRVLCRAGEIVLDKALSSVVRGIPIRLINFREKPARVAKDLWLDDQNDGPFYLPSGLRTPIQVISRSLRLMYRNMWPQASGQSLASATGIIIFAISIIQSARG